MKKAVIYLICSVIFLGISSNFAIAQDRNGQESAGDTVLESIEPNDETYTDLVLHHIADANEFHIVGDFSIPLPMILYDFKGGKFSFFLSSAFENGARAVDGYVLDHGIVRKVKDSNFPDGKVAIDGTFTSGDNYYAKHNGRTYEVQEAATLLNLGSANFIDFSITKNVATMILVAIFMIFLFNAISKGYIVNEGKAPKGVQSFFEPFIIFIRDDVAIPAIGKGWEKYFPFIASLFFFILFCNLLGIVPFFPGSANVMGNVGVTLALALIVFIVTSIKANKNYWQHIFWMPGVPTAVKPILALIEFLGMFTKPFTLLIRLFANMAAGHVIILSLVGLIFIMGNNGANMGGAVGGGIIGVPFVFAMYFLKIFVGALQAFIFALLAALYIGDATAEA